MKKILIIGQNSPIGEKLKPYLIHRSGGFMVNAISLPIENWGALDFGIYDCVIDLASDLDSDLAFQLARKAKEQGAASFMLFSTIEVYGVTPKIGKTVIIEKGTPCNPSSRLGKSKRDAEVRIEALVDDRFKVAILRMPLIYDPESDMQNDDLRNLLIKDKAIPAIRNQMSAIHISTACAFIDYLLSNQITGTFHPQNSEYLSTLELLEMMAKKETLPLKLSKFQALKMKIFKASISEEMHRAFGSVIYAKDIDS